MFLVACSLQIEDDVLRWANARLSQSSSVNSNTDVENCPAQQHVPLTSLSDPRLAEGQVCGCGCVGGACVCGCARMCVCVTSLIHTWLAEGQVCVDAYELVCKLVCVCARALVCVCVHTQPLTIHPVKLCSILMLCSIITSYLLNEYALLNINALLNNYLCSIFTSVQYLPHTSSIITFAQY